MTGTSDNDKNIPHGQHLLADLFGVEDPRLNDPGFFTNLIKEVLAASGLTPLASPQIYASEDSCHAFVALKNGHISIHSQPTAQYLAVDIFVAGNTDPEVLFAVVKKALVSQMVRKTTITRGLHN